MSDLLLVVIFSLLGGVGSLLGAFAVFAGKKRTNKIIEITTPFAAGALLAAAFVDLLPEALHGVVGDDESILIVSLAVLSGVLIFFILERATRWFHHHKHHSHDDNEKSATIPLIITGDTIHNFIDGVAIAAGFLVSPITGIITTLAVAAHEIPQEIGDFGLLLSKGMKKKKVILVNIFSALSTVVSAVIFFLIGSGNDIPLSPVLGVTAGLFIYIAISDIIPEIQSNEKKRFIGIQTIMLFVGVIVVGVLTKFLHGFIE